AVTVAEDFVANARALAAAWDPARGAFHRELATAGAGSATYATVQSGLNAVSDALFYLDLVTKDQKLAGPLGVTTACSVAPCSALVESPFAGRSTVNVGANLAGFRMLFQGCSGPGDLGFDDLLADVGQAALAARMVEALDRADGALRAVSEPALDVAIARDPQRVWALYDAVKAVTDLLKTEFVSVLDFGRPPEAGTDND
ncbi:MAG: hypothetical protein FJ104_17225, partial [Deltaproteobacteria bacterium]|nr:hypothetical protein [Deltaproteobacteria bacterium]